MGITEGAFWDWLLTDRAVSRWQMSDERLFLSSLNVALLLLSFTAVIPVCLFFFITHYLSVQ